MVKTKGSYDHRVNYGDILLKAIEDERMDLVKLLLTHKADPNVSGFRKENLTALFRAMRTGNFEMVEFLIDNGSFCFFHGYIQNEPIEYVNVALKPLIQALNIKQKQNVLLLMLSAR